MSKVEFWESGGGSSNSGSAIVYCGPRGEKLRAIERGGIAGRSHARFEWVDGMVRIAVYVRRGDVESVEIDAVSSDGERRRLYTYDRGEWTPSRFEEMPFLEAAKVAAEDKAQEYHCRRAVYAL